MCKTNSHDINLDFTCVGWLTKKTDSNSKHLAKERVTCVLEFQDCESGRHTTTTVCYLIWPESCSAYCIVSVACRSFVKYPFYLLSSKTLKVSFSARSLKGCSKYHWLGARRYQVVRGGWIGKKIIDLRGGQINEILSGKYFSLPFLPPTPSYTSQTLDGLFEMTHRVLQGPLTCLVHCF